MAKDLCCYLCAKWHKNSNFIFKYFKLSAMSPKILLASLVVTAFASCSTAYKSGQTPDDVYYSPVRTVQYEEKQERDQVRNEQENYEDREIRMRIHNQRWRYFENNYGYNYGSYNHYCNCYCNQGGWGYSNHPYANPSPLYYPGPIRFNNYAPAPPPRVVNLGGYNGSGNVVRTYTNPKTGVTTATPRYNNSNNSNSNTRGSGLGNAIREIFTPSSNNSNNSNNNSGRSNNNTRTYEPTSTPSNSGSSSSPSSSGGTVSRPGRGG